MKVRAIDSAGNLGAESAASANWIAVPFSCPTGYIAVPALAGYSLVDFCVAKYEMKNNFGAKSEATGYPWVTIARGIDATTINSAWKACKDLGVGYDLISNAQWQTIARNIADTAANWSSGTAYAGVLNSGHSDASPNYPLAASTDDDPYFGTGNTSSSGWGSGSVTVGNEQKRTHILSNGNIIWDFSGNVWEWVKDNNSSSQGVQGYSSTFNGGDSRQTNYGNDSFCATPLAAEYCGMGYGWTTTSGGAIMRGGAYGNGVSVDIGTGIAAGIFAVDLGWAPAPENAFSDLGFRCVYTPN
jgi:formylglycine-generating enzyme required for sulfatase activity